MLLSSVNRQLKSLAAIFLLIAIACSVLVAPSRGSEPTPSSTSPDIGRSNHWSLQPLRAQIPSNPGPQNAKAARGNAIDLFVVARLAAAGLALSPEADRLTLLRRLSFDLVGLPPTPQEIDAFLADSSARAYE